MRALLLPLLLPCIVIVFLSCCCSRTYAYFLNDQHGSLYFFNSDQNKDVWDNANTVCGLLGAQLITIKGMDASFLGDLKATALWSGVRTDPKVTTEQKFVYPDGTPFDTKTLSKNDCPPEASCCGVYIQRLFLFADKCDAKKAYICRFPSTVPDLKSNFQLIDSIMDQSQTLQELMANYTLRFESIEVSQGELELKIQEYNDSLSDDISKTISLTEDVAVMADEVEQRQTQFLDEAMDKIADMTDRVNEQIEGLRRDQNETLETLIRKQEDLSTALDAMQHTLESGVDEVLASMEVMNETLDQQSRIVASEIADITSGLGQLRDNLNDEIHQITEQVDAHIASTRQDIDGRVTDLSSKLADSQKTLAEIQASKLSLESKLKSTEEMISQINRDVKALAASTETEEETMVFVNATLAAINNNLRADEAKLKTLKTVTFTILGILVVAIIAQYAYIFRDKLAKLHPRNRSANLE